MEMVIYVRFGVIEVFIVFEIIMFAITTVVVILARIILVDILDHGVVVFEVLTIFVGDLLLKGALFSELVIQEAGLDQIVVGSTTTGLGLLDLGSWIHIVVSVLLGGMLVVAL